MTISVFTLFNEAFRPVADITLPVLTEYCRRHGYLFRAFENPAVKRTIVWDRLLPIFETDSEWSVYVDTDVLITNQDVDLESIISGFPNSDVIVGSDIHGPNDGMLMVRNSETARALVGRIAVMFSFPNVFCPQDAIRDIYLDEVMGGREGIAIAEQRAFNSYLYEEYELSAPSGQWQPGDFALHLPGRTNGRRVEIFSGLMGQ